MDKIYDTIIIGAGIGGMTAAIYLKRNNIDCMIIEKSSPGGQINRTSRVENYPGYKLISGPDLSYNVYTQIMELNVPLMLEEVTLVTKEDDIFKVTTNKNTYLAKTVIASSGRTPKETGIKSEKSLVSRGISYCALCDGNLYKGEEVAVIGRGKSAVEEALILSKIASKVYLFNKDTIFKAENALVDELLNTSNIEVIYNAEILDFKEENRKLDGVLYKVFDEEHFLEVSCVFIYIGNLPEVSYLKNLEVEYINGHIKTDSMMRTNVEGLFGVGDVTSKDVYQLVTSASDGAISATSVSNYLNRKG